MVFAVWAGTRAAWSEDLERAFVESLKYGLERIADIACAEYANRGVSFYVARDYLQRNIVFELGEKEYEGMRRFLMMARKIGPHRFLPAALTVGD